MPIVFGFGDIGVYDPPYSVEVIEDHTKFKAGSALCIGRSKDGTYAISRPGFVGHSCQTIQDEDIHDYVVKLGLKDTCWWVGAHKVQLKATTLVSIPEDDTFYREVLES